MPNSPTCVSHIDHWIFDLDNTLYPSHINLFDQIDQKMGSFLAKFLETDLIEARKIQKDYYHRYGTTLSGLMIEHKLKPETFLHYVHDIDYSLVKPNSDLRAALQNLPGKRTIFTNGSVSHAQKVAENLNILDLFDTVFDIKAAKFTPKPHRLAFDHFLKATKINPKTAIMFEDLHRNLLVPHELGMKTVLVQSDYNDHPNQKEQDNWHELPSHIHHQTDDLTTFLKALV